MKSQIIVKVYKGTQEQATKKFQSDAVKMSSQGYFPTSQSWAAGSYGCAEFLFALILCFLVIGIFIFIYMALVKPPGTLSVTYELRSGADSSQQNPMSFYSTPPPPLPPAPRSENSFYVYLGDEVKGPFTIDQIRALKETSAISFDTPCCKVGSEDWIPAEDVY